MKIHLRILYGCDDRYEISTNTINVCESYFDTTKILNAGPKEFYDKLRNGVSANVKVEQLEKFLEIESARRALIDDVPLNDWVLWLDADERPSEELLINLRKLIETAEIKGFDSIKLIWAEHTDGIPIPVKEPRPKTHEEFINGNSACYFMPKRIIKLKPGYKLASHFGAHEEFTNKQQKIMYSPYIIHHMKSHLQYYQSVVFSGFLNPIVHYNCSKLEDLKEFINLKYFKELKEFQKRTGVFTSNDLVKKIKIDKDQNFIKELKELFLSFPDGDTSGGLGQRHNEMYITFKFMRIFAEKYNLDVNSPHYICGKSCCKYGDIQL